YWLAQTRQDYLTLLFLALPLAAAQPWPRCDPSSGNYSAGSAYETNLLNLVLTLRQDASSSASRFASGTLGAAPDTVYGLVLCRGDVTASECLDCGTSAYEKATTACGRRIRDVALCFNPCYVRLSDNNFLASANNSGEIPLISGTSISSSDVAGYDRALTGLLNATVHYAVDNSTQLFATGQWVGPDPGFSHIYSAAQCAGDLSPALCRSCLQGLLRGWFTKFRFLPNGDGSRVAGSRCTLRSEVGKTFFNGAAMVQLPAKAAAPPPAATAVPVPGTTGGEDYILNWEQRLHIAFDAAQGLEYLHELCTPSIVHRDVKTPNILLDKNLVGIISDFGLSRAFNDAHTHISTVAAGTLGYLDPEYHATFQLTVKTDVYSFGIVLLEIITAQPPVIMDPQPVHLPKWVRQKIAKGSIHDVVDKKLLDQYNVSSLQSVIDLAMDCVENAAVDRPAMTEVVSKLKVLLPLVTSEKRSIYGTTQYKNSMDSEISQQYQLTISGASTEGSSFQSGYTGGMSAISMSSGR
ncbi:cysteine-rich receptor-like protein kinase 6, partial [Triticum aestivum]